MVREARVWDAAHSFQYSSRASESVKSLVLGRIYRDIRSFRIYDGATEVHKMSIARRAAARARDRQAPRPESA